MNIYLSEYDKAIILELLKKEIDFPKIRELYEIINKSKSILCRG